MQPLECHGETRTNGYFDRLQVIYAGPGIEVVRITACRPQEPRDREEHFVGLGRRIARGGEIRHARGERRIRCLRDLAILEHRLRVIEHVVDDDVRASGNKIANAGREIRDSTESGMEQQARIGRHVVHDLQHCAAFVGRAGATGLLRQDRNTPGGKITRGNVVGRICEQVRIAAVIAVGQYADVNAVTCVCGRRSCVSNDVRSLGFVALARRQATARLGVERPCKPQVPHLRHRIEHRDRHAARYVTAIATDIDCPEREHLRLERRSVSDRDRIDDHVAVGNRHQSDTRCKRICLPALRTPQVGVVLVLQTDEVGRDPGIDAGLLRLINLWFAGGASYREPARLVSRERIAEKNEKKSGDDTARYSLVHD